MYGYNKDGKQLVVNQDTAPVVQEIFDLYSKSWGYQKIATYLNKKGIIEDNDALITFNYRPDRLRELFGALTNKNNKNFHLFLNKSCLSDNNPLRLDERLLTYHKK